MIQIQMNKYDDRHVDCETMKVYQSNTITFVHGTVVEKLY